jgi:hypothetical protein
LISSWYYMTESIWIPYVHIFPNMSRGIPWKSCGTRVTRFWTVSCVMRHETYKFKPETKIQAVFWIIANSSLLTNVKITSVRRKLCLFLFNKCPYSCYCTTRQSMGSRSEVTNQRVRLGWPMNQVTFSESVYDLQTANHQL